VTVLQKKICLLGDFAVGKTSLIRRFVEGRFEDQYLSTIGVKISRKPVALPNLTMNLLVWDMTGGEELSTQTRLAYLRGAAGALLVCDLTRRETLVVFERYAQQLRVINPQTTLVFIGNKLDREDRDVSDGEMLRVCRSLGNSKYFLTSAKTGSQVEDAFLYLASIIEKSS
jgi:small GTP-binding protein